MIEMRHAGIYVEDLSRMEAFYQNVFSMKVILSKVRTSDILIDAIVGTGKAVLISKLITPRGCTTSSGDMVELLQVEKEAAPPDPGPVFQTGTAHLGFGVDDMETDRASDSAEWWLPENRHFADGQQSVLLLHGSRRQLAGADPEKSPVIC